MPSSSVVGHVAFSTMELVLSYVALYSLVLPGTLVTGHIRAFLCQVCTFTSITLQRSDGVDSRRVGWQPQLKLNYYITELIIIEWESDDKA